jgi:hypothetical protein
VFFPVHGFAFAKYAITEFTPSITPATRLNAPEGPTDNPELPTHVRTPAETEHVELSGCITPTVELVALFTLIVLPETTMGAVPVYVVPEHAPTVQMPPLPTAQSPLTGARPAGELLALLMTR